MATIREVAALAGVSVATVSRVLNGTGYVNAETERKIRAAIRSLDYEPSGLARGLAGKSTSLVALVVPDMTNPFFPELARAVEDVCSDRGYTLVLCHSDNDARKARAYIDALMRNRAAGFIFAADAVSGKETAALRRAGTPAVILDRSGGAEHCSIVRVDNAAGARLATRHLLERGCRKIAHIYGPPHIDTARERLLGYESVVRELPWYTPSLLLPGDFGAASGTAAVEELLRRHPDADGLFAGNDLMAIGALKALLRRGVRVPDDVAVCGFDGIAMSALTEPELSTVAQPVYAMGKLAAETLIGHIEQGGGAPCVVHELQAELIARQSTERTGGA